MSWYVWKWWRFAWAVAVSDGDEATYDGDGRWVPIINGSRLCFLIERHARPQSW